MDCVTIDVMRREGETWGVQISGEEPCYIESVQEGSPASEAGLEVGDYIISINGVSVYDACHDHVVKTIGDCGRIARFRVLPNQNASTTPISSAVHTGPKQKSKGSQIKQWKNSFNRSDSESEESPGEEESEEYCGIDKKYQTTTEERSFDIQVRYDKVHDLEKKKTNLNKKEIHVEQSSFIVTPETQKQFDEHYHHEGNFVGRRATVAGAFTGDFNVIRNHKEEDDVLGVKSRVLAGIQHFSFSEKNEKIAEEDRNKIILYTTSLGIHRSIAYKCEEARKILRGFRVKFEDRDVYNDSQYKIELYKRLGLSDGDKLPALPRLYIDGVCAGGFDEIQEMSDCGDLRIRFQDFPKYNIRKHCTTCQAKGIINCKSCKGEGYRQKNRFTTLKCGSCHQHGTVSCPDCL